MQTISTATADAAGAATVDIQQRIIGEDVFKTFCDGVADGKIALDILLGVPIAPIPMADRRRVLQDGFGHSGTRVEAY